MQDNNHKYLSIIWVVMAVGVIIDVSRQSWQQLQNTQAVNCVSIQNSADEKMSFANLINLCEVANLDYSCEGAS